MSLPAEPPGLLLAGAGARVLLVGSGSYVPGSSLPAVPAIGRTLEDLGRCLVERAGLEPSRLTALLDPADPREFGAALVAAADSTEDILVCYYVGHGLVDPRGDLHLATRATLDLTRGIAGHQALPYAALAEVLGECRAPLVLVVLDCCFAGRAGGVSPALDQAFAASQYGGYVLAAVGRDEAAWAPESAQHTAFSGALIHVLNKGDPAAGPYLGVEEVYQALTRRLASGGLPSPRRQSNWPLGVPPLVPNPAGVAGADGAFSPYRGLTSFGPQDAAYFFGRAEMTASLSDRVAAQALLRVPLLVVGPSGAGKSSLLHAGLVPVLERSAGTRVMLLTPGRDPVGTLAARLTPVTGEQPADLRERLMNDPGALPPLLAGPGQRVIVVDQFEELFTLCGQEPERRAFLAALSAACTVAVVVIGLRADFFGRCVAYDELASALEHPVVVTSMTPAQLREVIVRPAELTGLTLQPGLADLLLEDVGVDLATSGPQGVLPLLSHVLLATWQRREDGVLTIGGYRATGGIGRALANTADAVLTGLDLPGQRAARRLLPRLVRLGEGAEDTRTRLPLADLLSGDPGEQDDLRRALDRFIAARLVTVDADGVEISHEALIRAWPRLRAWIDADRAALLIRQQLDQQARDWIGHDRDPSYLYAGTRLAVGEEAHTRWSAQPDAFPPFSERSREFLKASVEAREQARRADERAHRIRRRSVATAAASLVVVVVASITAAVIAGRAADEADQQRRLALSQKVALQSENIAQGNPVLSRLLAVAAFRLAPTPEARRNLARALADPARNAISGLPESSPRYKPNTSMSSYEPNRLTTVMGGPRPALIIGDAQGRIRVHPRHSESPSHVIQTADGLTTLASDPTGAALIIAAAGVPQSVTVWEPGRPYPVRRLRWPGLYTALTLTTGRVNGHSVIAALTDDGRIYLWGSGSDEPLRELDAGSRPIGAEHEAAPIVVGEADGQPFVAAGNTTDSTVRVWAHGLDKAPRVLRLDPKRPATALSLTREGGAPKLIVGTEYGRILSYGINSRAPHRVLDQGGSVTALATGTLHGVPVIVSGDLAGDIKVWSRTGARPIRSLRAATTNSSVDALAVTGSEVVATYGDGSARVWGTDLAAPLRSWRVREKSVDAMVAGPLRPGPAVTVGPLGPGPAVAVAEWGGRIRVHDAGTGTLLYSFYAGARVADLAAGSLDGQPTLVSVSDNSSVVKVWRPGRRAPVQILDAGRQVFATAIGQVAGKSAIMAAGADGKIVVWNAGDEGPPRILSTRSRGDPSVSFTVGVLDGQPVIVTGDYPGYVRVYPTGDSEPVRTIAIGGPVATVALGDIDGMPVLVAARNDGQVSLYGSDDDKPLRTLSTGFRGGGLKIGRTAGGPVIVEGRIYDSVNTTGIDVRLWQPLLPANLPAAVCAQVDRQLTTAEWRQYVGGRDTFRPPCPVK
ncbi:caspase, EACC1-associated type [Nonomuraea fuscirosea]|uniref:caspase, EACC1-associated type n=1 Tax=Nonomuraea fuscirosea TaxID=1291556 RepID=UPI00342DA1E0